MSFDEYGIHIAVLYIHYYALILMVAMLVGAWVTARRARAVGLDENIVWDGLLWAIIPGSDRCASVSRFDADTRLRPLF